MNNQDKVELALIAAATGLAFTGSDQLPASLALGNLLVIIATLIFVQSLLRDVSILLRHRSRPAAAETRTLMCMCAETTVGTLLMITGLLLLGFAANQTISMNTWRWSGVVGLSCLGCFLIKDYVLQVRPWALRRDPDHLNIIVSWKR